METITTVAAIVVAYGLLIPSVRWLRRVLAYPQLADIISAGYVVSTYAAAGAAGGLTIAVFAALAISLTLRFLRLTIGYDQIAIDGDTSLATIAAAFLTQAVRWVRSLVYALFRGGRIDAPPALGISWVEVRPSWYAMS